MLLQILVQPRNKIDLPEEVRAAYPGTAANSIVGIHNSKFGYKTDGFKVKLK
jgi:hypothetical protein